jgi:non-heme chloroperoxidase
MDALETQSACLPVLGAVCLQVLVLGSFLPSQGSAKVNAWHDPSPHQVRFVEVDPATRLEVLDWGGTGDTIVLLAGLGNSAHVFDDFAQKLTDRFRVVGITRRGNGASSRPSGGYDISTLTDDVRHVLDALTLRQAHLVGHSIAGDEITTFAGRYPGRLLKAVYIDAAYDHVNYAPDMPGAPAPTTAELSSPVAFRAYRARIIALQPEAEIRATVVFDSEGRATKNSTPPEVWAAIEQSVTHPAYSNVRAAALAIYATPSKAADMAPSYEAWTPSNKARLERLFEAHLVWAAEQRRTFAAEVRRGRVVEIYGATHYVFISNEADVLKEMRSFLLAP